MNEVDLLFWLCISLMSINVLFGAMFNKPIFMVFGFIFFLGTCVGMIIGDNNFYD